MTINGIDIILAIIVLMATFFRSGKRLPPREREIRSTHKFGSKA